MRDKSWNITQIQDIFDFKMILRFGIQLCEFIARVSHRTDFQRIGR